MVILSSYDKESEINWRAEAERLQAEVTRLGEAFEYHKSESARKTLRITDLSSEVEKQRAEIFRLGRASQKDASGSIKAFNTLLKMVGGMAMAVYGFGPGDKRSNVVADIQNDLDLKGIILDADTIRKWLRKAGKLLKAAEKHESKPK